MSESLSDPDLKTKIVAVARDVAQRPLLILSHKRQLVRHAILERQHLILILRQVGRIGHTQVVIDLPTDRQPCGRV